MSIWMTRFNWRTAKQQEAGVIREYIFEKWIEECCVKDRAREAEGDEEDQLKAYEWARDAGDKVASNFADRHFGRM